MMGQYMNGQEEVVSHLNISVLKDTDGGEYSCTAKNSLAQITRSARINVYGRFWENLIYLSDSFVKDLDRNDQVAIVTSQEYKKKNCAAHLH